MKKSILFLLLSLCLTLNAQRYDDPVYMGHGRTCYDNVIEDEDVVENVLVVHQPTINYYHVNGVPRENHYYMGSRRICNTRGYVRGRVTVRQRVYERRYYAEPPCSGGYTRVEPLYSGQYQSVGGQNKWFFIFQLNSDYLTNREELAHLIDYAKTNTNTVFYIDSYADAETGTVEYNMNISIRRANAIINVLLNEGISNNRLFVNNHGCSSQEYRTNNLNRCVIVKAVVK